MDTPEGGKRGKSEGQHHNAVEAPELAPWGHSLFFVLFMRCEILLWDW